MDFSLAFTICSAASTIGWVALFLFPRRTSVNFWLCGTIIPCGIGLFYTLLCILYWHSIPASFLARFGSLDGMLAMFSASRGLLLAGFVHYLAFDLFAGAWEARRSTLAEWPYWLLFPCLVLTLLFGPAGVMVHQLIFIARGQHQPEHLPIPEPVDR